MPNEIAEEDGDDGSLLLIPILEILNHFGRHTYLAALEFIAPYCSPPPHAAATITVLAMLRNS